jgi:BR serine/threonine kinase
MSQREIGNYVLGRTIGTGVSGKVKLATHKETGEQAAVKIIEKSSFQATRDLEDKTKREIALMHILNHPHVLRLLEVCESPNHLYLIIEYCSNGELFDFLVSQHHLEPRDALFLFRQLIFGLDYMHSFGICHRDLKTENLLLDEYGRLKIADFGFARWMKSDLADTTCGSPHYTAPEVTHGGQYDGRGADVWSAGVILYTLLVGSLPFEDPSLRGLVTKVRSGSFAMPGELPAPIQDLIRQILVVDVDKRLKITGIKAHPAFRLYLPEGYIIPVPLPMPMLLDPVPPELATDRMLAILRSIGYSDAAELERDLNSHETSMAKVFIGMYNRQTSIAELPWPEVPGSPLCENLEDAEIESAFIMQGRAMVADGVASDPFARRAPRAIASVGGFVSSLAYKASWAVQPVAEVEAESEQLFSEIPLTVAGVLTEMQGLFTRRGICWFHPDDENMIGKVPPNTFVKLEGWAMAPEMSEISVTMVQGDSNAFAELIDAISAAVQDIVDRA